MTIRAGLELPPAYHKRTIDIYSAAPDVHIVGEGCTAIPERLRIKRDPEDRSGFLPAPLRRTAACPVGGVRLVGQMLPGLRRLLLMVTDVMRGGRRRRGRRARLPISVSVVAALGRILP